MDYRIARAQKPPVNGMDTASHASPITQEKANNHAASDDSFFGKGVNNQTSPRMQIKGQTGVERIKTEEKRS